MPGPSNETNKSWVVFLDLLGTKQFAVFREDGDIAPHVTLKNKLEDLSRYIKSKIIIRFFSDSVYIEAEELEPLIVSLARLRRSLMAQGVFFKASLRRGQLGEIPIAKSENNAQGYHVEMTGSLFGPEAVSVYETQERFKGVGFFIEPSSELSSDFFCDTAFPVDNVHGRWQKGLDIRYWVTSDPKAKSVLFRTDIVDIEEQVAFIDGIILAALKANTSQRNLSRKYLSSLISIINSSDFTQIAYSGGEWSDYPAIFHTLVVDQKRRAGIKAISGYDSLFLCLITNILRQRIKPFLNNANSGTREQAQQLIDRVIEVVVQNNVFTSTIPRYPDVVATPEAINLVSNVLANVKLGISIRRKPQTL